MPIPEMPLICRSDAQREAAAALAAHLRAPLLTDIDPQSIDDSDFVLVWDDAGLALQQTGRKVPGPVRVEFTEGALDHRRKQGGGKGQMIAKAVGIKAGVYPQVLDLTAGLGKDAFVLASLGCSVQLVERSPLVFALLQDGLRRGRDFAAQQGDQVLMKILARMTLTAADGRAFLAQLDQAQQPDVIYLDPMFPEREKTADVKKDMRAFHTLVGRDEDADELLAAALAHARYRVVVKRPRKAPALGGQGVSYQNGISYQKGVSYQIEGKSSRYDIYALKKLPERLPTPAV